MALIGVEYVDNFADARAAGETTAQDLSCPYYIANWFAPTLAAAGHTIIEHANKGVYSFHMTDTKFGGDDTHFADSVDLFLIITHGNYEPRDTGAQPGCRLLFDNYDWHSYSKDWRFGDGCNLEWLLIYGCHTIDRDHVLDHLPVFKRLHLFCGAYGNMYDSWTTDDVGEDTANNLLSGNTVCDSWGDGVSDWFVSNHPMVVSVELQWTYNNGDVLWEETTIGCDHLWGEGYTFPDITPADQYWMASMWWDGGIYG
jgi:hypothetical protein